MDRKYRLSLIALIIIASCVYAALISYNPRIASAIALGYIALVLTVFLIGEVWRKHE